MNRFSTLKRSDEGEMVVKAHLNPMFVEDIVRAALGSITRWILIVDRLVKEVQ